MVQDFFVDNFLSFGTRQEFSFEASSDTTSEANLVVRIKHPKSGATARLLRMCVLYGANASGKTNLLYAIRDIWAKMYYPFASKDEKIWFCPFAIRRAENTRMGVSFFIDGVKYSYSIEYNGSEIVYELLEFNPNGVSSLFYERKHNYKANLPEITFGKNAGLDGKAASVIITNTLSNHSVLSTYNKISVEAPAFEKIIRYVGDCVLDTQSMIGINDLLKATLGQQRKKEFLLRAVREADFNISDIISREDGKGDAKIEFEHEYAYGHFSMPIESESAGTLSFVGKMDLMYEVMRKGRFMMVDEIDDSLHHDLLVYMLQTFLSNESQAQILFTVHDQLILSEDFIRRDMVWFTEKDKNTSSTELFSADDFNLHKNASIFNAYKLGKLGARPSVGSPFMNLDTIS